MNKSKHPALRNRMVFLYALYTLPLASIAIGGFSEELLPTSATVLYYLIVYGAGVITMWYLIFFLRSVRANWFRAFTVVLFFLSFVASFFFLVASSIGLIFFDTLAPGLLDELATDVSFDVRFPLPLILISFFVFIAPHIPSFILLGIIYLAIRNKQNV